MLENLYRDLCDELPPDTIADSNTLEVCAHAHTCAHMHTCTHAHAHPQSLLPTVDTERLRVIPPSQPAPALPHHGIPSPPCPNQVLGLSAAEASRLMQEVQEKKAAAEAAALAEQAKSSRRSGSGGGHCAV